MVFGVRRGGDDAGGSPSALDLQDQIMRFEGRFSSRLASAFRPLANATENRVRLRAQRDCLAYLSSALDIAISSTPEVDVVDMVTLVALGRDQMKGRWPAETYGEQGRAILDAFDKALEDISRLARSALPADVEGELRRVIDEWKAENPEVDDVAAVRLSAYAELNERGTSTQRKVAGLFSIVRGAASTADAAVLLGERALYATQRLPYLLRMHVRVATSELVSDLTKTFEGTSDSDLAMRIRAARTNVQALGKRAMTVGALACAGIAVISAASWFFARRTYDRLGSR